MSYKIHYRNFFEVIDYLLVFMLLFAFPLPFLNSAKIAIILILFRVLLFKDVGINVFQILKSKYLFTYLYVIVTFILYTAFLTIFKNEYDFTLFDKQVSSLIYTILAVVFFSDLSKKYAKVESLIFFSFFLQSIFIIAAVISQEFYELTSPFRIEISSHHFDTYGRLRGNAISGYQFFGIASMYGIFILYCIVENKIKGLKKILMFSLIVIAGMVSGRFVISAILLGFIVNFLFKLSFKRKIRSLLQIIISLLVLLTTLIYTYENISDENLKGKMDFYFMWPIKTYMNSGNFNTSSTDNMLRMYDELEIKNLFSGDGRYTKENSDGYYGSVDMGYLRMILYYGVFGMIIIFFIQFLLLNKLLKIPPDRIFISKLMFLYFLILNIKGDVLFYNNNVLPLIIGLIYFTGESKLKKTSQAPSN
jgi:hypothetical protein